MVKEGYKQTEIGVIPEDWEVKDAASFGTMVTGSTPSTNNDIYWNGEFPWVTPSDITTLKYISKTERNITSEGVSVVTELPPNTLLVTCIASIGKNAILTKRGACNQQINAIIPSVSFDVDFLYYLVENNKNYLLANSGITATRIISKNDFSKLRFAVPVNYIEQKSIAQALSDVDDMIVSLEKLIEKKEAIKQGAMQDLLTGKKRLSGFTGEWRINKLEDYCILVTKQTGFDYSAYIKPALTKRKTNESLPMIQTINFRGKKFDFSTDYYIPISVAKNFPNIILDEKCVLFSIVGASVGNIGLYPGGISFCGGAIGITRFYDEDDADWIYYYMNSVEGQSQIQQVTKGGAQATVTIADIRNFSIPTPEKKERQEIVSILSDIDSEIEELEQKLNKTRKLKQGMMQQLLTGKIRLV